MSDDDIDDISFDPAVADLLADPRLWDDPPLALGDAVVAAVAAEVRAGGQAPVARPVPARRAAAGRRRWMAPLGAVAAAALVAVGAFVVARGGDESEAARVEMAGTDLLPGATGTAHITALQSGLRIELDAPGLPRRDGDEFYEAWLKSVDGTKLVPVGTFHEGDDVVLWAGVALEDFPILTVTREVVAGPQDPGQGSSGEVVLAGTYAP